MPDNVRILAPKCQYGLVLNELKHFANIFISFLLVYL
jgi:hypothetical protein